MRRVVVTGGSGGIGRAVVDAFLADRAHVVNLDLNAPSSTLPEGARLDTVLVDLAKPRNVRRAFEMVDDLFAEEAPQVLVSCAAISQEHHFLDVEEEDYERIMDVNVRGTFFVCQEAARRMCAAGEGGHIVVVTSVCDTVGWAGEPVYTISKGAQFSLVQSLAVELAPEGIAVNAVSPFAIDVESTGMAATRDSGDSRRQMLERTPTGRLGRPEEIAAAVKFLSEATWVTGQKIVVDGGFLATGIAYQASRSATLARSATLSSHD